MERQIIDVPTSLLGYEAFDWEINVRGRSAGESVTGAGQVVYGVRPRWEANAEFTLLKPSQILVWRAILSRLRGRVNILRMRVNDPLRPSQSATGLAADDIQAGQVPHSDDTLFDDDTGYAVEATAPVSAAASPGVTSITVNADHISDALQPGHFFSINDWLYRVTGISGSSAARVYDIEPPLRADVAEGDSVRPDARTLVVFEADMQSTPAMERIPVSTIKLRLLEHVNR